MLPGFKAQTSFQSLRICIKNESGTWDKWLRWDDKKKKKKYFAYSSTRTKKEKKHWWWAASRTFQEGFLEEKCFYTLQGRVYSAVVCGQCVWVKIRPVAGHIWGSWKRAVRKVISRVLQQRPGGWDGAEEWQAPLQKPDQPSKGRTNWVVFFCCCFLF